MARQQLGAEPANANDAVEKRYADLIAASKLHNAGVWSGTASYGLNDIVSYGGCSYVCTAAVAAPAATSYVGASGGYSATNGAANVNLPAGCAAGDLVIIGLTNDQGLTVPAVPVTGATRLGTVIPGNNSSFGYEYYYSLTSTDVSNGYLACAAQTVGTMWAVEFQVFRNAGGTPNTGTSNYYTTTLITTTVSSPTAYPAYQVAFTGSLCTSTANTISNSGLSGDHYTTGQSTGSGTHILSIGSGYASIASGTPAATTFVYSARNTSGNGWTIECFVPQSAGTPNTDPAGDAAHWQPLAGPGAMVTITDWNAISSPGFYFGINASNGPAAHTYTGLVLGDPSTPDADLGLILTRLANTDTPEVWFRQRRGDTLAWGTWYPLLSNYAEEVMLAAQTITGSTVTQLTHFTAGSAPTIGASAFNLTTGVWTCPGSGWYSFSLGLMWGSFASGLRSTLIIARNGVATTNEIARAETSIATTSSTGHSMTVTRYMAAGDTVNFLVYQNTGASKTITAEDNSFISVLRER